MTASTVAAAAAVAGAATSAVGAISQGYAAAESARQEGQARAYQAQVSRNNAIIAEQQAQRTEAAAAQQATAKSMEVAARVGRVKAAQAASGIDVNTGTAVDVQAGTRLMGKLDTDTLFSNKMLEAYGYRTRGADYTTQAGLDDYRSRTAYGRMGDAVTSGYLKAGGTLLSSASSLPLKWSGGTTLGAGTSGYTGTVQGSGGDYGASV